MANCILSQKIVLIKDFKPANQADFPSRIGQQVRSVHFAVDLMHQYLIERPNTAIPTFSIRCRRCQGHFEYEAPTIRQMASLPQDLFLVSCLHYQTLLIEFFKLYITAR